VLNVREAERTKCMVIHFLTELIVITYSHIYQGEKKNCSLMTIINTEKSISTTTEHAVSFSSIARIELTRLPTHVKGA